MCHSLAIWSSAYSCLLCHLPLSYNQLAPLTSEHSCASSLHTWYILYIPVSQTLTASLFVTHNYARLSRTSPWTSPDADPACLWPTHLTWSMVNSFCPWVWDYPLLLWILCWLQLSSKAFPPPCYRMSLPFCSSVVLCGTEALTALLCLLVCLCHVDIHRLTSAFTTLLPTHSLTGTAANVVLIYRSVWTVSATYILALRPDPALLFYNASRDFVKRY